MENANERLLAKAVFDMTSISVMMYESGEINCDDDEELFENIYNWADAFTVLYNNDVDKYEDIIQKYAEKLLLRTYGVKKTPSKAEEVAGDILVGLKSFDFDPHIPSCQQYTWKCYLVNNMIEFDALFVALFNNKNKIEYSISEFPKWIICYSDEKGNGGIAGSISDFTKEIMTLAKELGETACNIIRKVV